MARSQTPYAVFPQVTILDFFKRNALLIVSVGLFVTFWMLVYTFTVHKPNYAAKATVIIKDSAITSRYIEPEQYYALQTTSSSSSNPVLNTMGILKSGAISDALWNYFQTKHPEQLKKNNIKTKKDWTSFFQDGSAFIKAKNQPGTDLIAIQFRWSDPVIAKEALAVVVKAFQDASRDLNKEEQISRTKFLNKQVVEIEKELAAIRKQKSEYQSTKRTVSVKREGDDLAGSRMELSNKLSQLESQARGKENMVRRYQQLLGMSPETALKASAIGQNSTMTRLQDELYRLQQQYSNLNSSLTESNPKVREVQAQIDQVKASIEAEQARTMGKTRIDSKNGIVADNTRNTLITHMLQAQGEAQDLRAQAAVIRLRLGQINRDIRSFPETAEGLANIEQKEASLSAALDQLREKVLEGKLKEEQTLSNVFIVDAPRLPEKAQFPTRTHLVVLSILLGLGVGISTAFAKEQFFTGVPLNMPNWLEPIEDEHSNNDLPGNGNGQNSDQPKEQSLPTRTPQALPAPQPQAIQALLPATSMPEKVELPTAGSLFDALVPVAGPMKHAPALNHQPEFRRDLTQPLQPTQPIAARKASPAAHQSQPPLQQYQPAAVASRQPAITRQSDAHLLPPEPVAPQRAKTVKVAAPPADPSILQRLNRPNQPKSLNTELSGVPILHAAPSPQPVMQTVSSASAEAAEATNSSAQALYEAQAKSMPLPPRRRRSIPAFLLDGHPSPEQQASIETEAAPYTLVPKKQLLAANDNLLEDVAPLKAPDAVQVESSNSGIPVEPDSSPIPGFMRKESTKPQRKPLLANLLFGKKPSRHPEIYFGIGARSQKELELPGSLNRLMHTLDKNQATIDS